MDMPTRKLDSGNKQEVASFQKLETIVDTPDQGPRHLLIFTGIAASRWDSDGDLKPLTVIVKLGAILPETPKKTDWAATVGLSNITNKDDSDFLFALNSISLDRDAKTDELELVVDIAVQGDGGVATLNSFTFQVTVLTEPPKIELDSLLLSDVRGLSFGPSVLIETGQQWLGQVSLKEPAPGNVDVFLFSGKPSVAPLRMPGDPAVSSVTIKKGDVLSPIFTAAPTFNQTNSQIDVTISAALVAGSKTAVVKVLPVTN
jgi:hypothetical protein